jgi:hypothetical protein
MPGWKGTPPIPVGWELAELKLGDTLLILERDTKLPASRIAEVNGVPWPGKKTCNWARDVAAWVLATGGERFAPVASEPNTCEPGQGYPHFVVGQRILLPAGVRPRAPSSAPPPVSSGVPVKAAGGGLALAALAAVALFLRGRRKRKAAA